MFDFFIRKGWTTCNIRSYKSIKANKDQEGATYVTLNCDIFTIFIITVEKCYKVIAVIQFLLSQNVTGLAEDMLLGFNEMLCQLYLIKTTG